MADKKKLLASCETCEEFPMFCVLLLFLSLPLAPFLVSAQSGIGIIAIP